MTLGGDGRVVVAGGVVWEGTHWSPVDRVDVYDVAHRHWSYGANLRAARSDGAAVALKDGRVAVDAWQEQGFGAVAKNYLGRLSPESGMRREIAENGDLLVRRMATSAGGPERRSLLHALAEPSWLDPATGGPRR